MDGEGLDIETERQLGVGLMERRRCGLKRGDALVLLLAAVERRVKRICSDKSVSAYAIITTAGQFHS
jgi:hypothetical protein